jgi:hypothetical protein
MKDRNFVSRQTAEAIKKVVYEVQNLTPKRSRNNRRVIRSLSSAASAGGNFAQCTILSELATDQYSVTVTTGNPQGTTEDSTGILYFQHATTNAVAIGGVIWALTYEHEGAGGVDFDCFPIETTMNLLAPEEEE